MPNQTMLYIHGGCSYHTALGCLGAIDAVVSESRSHLQVFGSTLSVEGEKFVVVIDTLTSEAILELDNEGQNFCKLCE